ncbi:MAG: DUF898 domain-containing protein [Caulobacterales bacterium]|nr:DUF898 domain-containing protein [Caulobacterales bacterium]
MSDTAATAPGASGPGTSVTFQQTGRWPSLVGLVVMNALLNIITLTLYRFWARTAVRRRLWSTTEINGEALEYTGTGWQLFRSFLIIVFVFLLPLFAVIFGAQLLLPAGIALILIYVLYFFLGWLFGLAVWLTRRFRLSRTTWRGIRFGMQGSGTGYAWAALGYALLTGITLGWYAPAMDMRLSRRMWLDTTFGDRKFTFAERKGLAGPLYPTFALAWFAIIGAYAAIIAAAFAILDPMTSAPPSVEGIITLYVAALGIMFLALFLVLPYQAALWRRIAGSLRLEGLTFSIRATAPSLAWLYVGNTLIVILTLGLGLPFAQLRNFRYIFNRLESEGALDVDAIAQSPDKGPEIGEGLADAFDIGSV